jgi:threonine dehydratase
MKLNLSDFKHAYDELQKSIQPTPLVFNEWLSKKYNCEIFLKLENMLPIGSFKMRGATYRLSQISKNDRKKGVLAVSAGNHAQGVAWAAAKFNVKATIIMPEGSPLTKIRNTEMLGAKVILHGQSIEECFEYAKKYMQKNPQIFIHPFSDKDVILGQGSVGFEILNQLPDVDMVFSSIGGGGLVSGIGCVLKSMKPKVKLIAGQASGASSMSQSLQKKKLVQTDKADTFADGIRVKKADAMMFGLLKKVVDETYAIDDHKIALAILQLLEKARVIAEGAGALPLAVLDEIFHKNPAKLKGKKIVLVICGGNIDVNLLERIIDRGLIESNRKVRLIIPIADKPGTLHRLTQIIKDTGANVLEVMHDRDSFETGISGTNVQFTLETKGLEHLNLLLKNLRKDYPNARVIQ